MDGTGDHCVEQHKPRSERQISHVLTHMQNQDLKTNNMTLFLKGDC
jgi:hypothetical protein